MHRIEDSAAHLSVEDVPVRQALERAWHNQGLGWLRECWNGASMLTTLDVVQRPIAGLGKER